jgi:hypothetical protein
LSGVNHGKRDRRLLFVPWAGECLDRPVSKLCENDRLGYEQFIDEDIRNYLGSDLIQFEPVGGHMA